MGIAKQNVMIWNYSNGGGCLSPSTIPANSRVQLLEENPKWWKVKSGRKEGFASKHYFVHREAKKEYERKPWYFGDMTREDAERLLGDTANPDGSFLIRHTDKNNGMEVLTLKYFNTRPPEPEIYKYMNSITRTTTACVYQSVSLSWVQRLGPDSSGMC